MERTRRIPKINEEIIGEYVLIDWKKINDFAKLTQDFNPIHVDLRYIQKHTIYRTPLAHGIIGVSLICALLGNTYNEILLKSQTISFLKPVLLNTKVRAKVKCLNVFEVNKTYKNIEISFNVELIDEMNNIYIKGSMVGFMWGEKR